MKKYWMRMFCLTMILSLVLCGCATDQKSELVGIWTGTVDLSEAVQESLDLGEVAEYVSVSDFTLDLTMMFNDDGMYSLSVSLNSASAAVEGLRDQLVEGRMRYMEATLEEKGSNVTLEQYAALKGYTMDELIEKIREQVNEEYLSGENTTSELAVAFCFDGRFENRDGKLYLSFADDEEIDESACADYSLSGSTLTIEMADFGGDYAAISPLVLNKG